jgi:large subunit ribosomal protein L25
VVFDLQIEGYSDPQGTAALIKSMQRHPLTRIPESVDFQWISLRERVNVSVPIHLEGSSPAQADGAVIDQILHEVEVSCMPLSIPESLVLSIEGMQLHETRTVSQLDVPEGVEVLADADTPVATCVPPAKMVSEDEGMEAVEGEIESIAEVEDDAQDRASGGSE